MSTKQQMSNLRSVCTLGERKLYWLARSIVLEIALRGCLMMVFLDQTNVARSLPPRFSWHVRDIRICARKES